MRRVQPCELRTNEVGVVFAAGRDGQRAVGRRRRRLIMARVSPAEREQATGTTKWVYLFREGSAEMRELLGGKGAGVAGMTRAGLPVPPGFTITTEACNAYFANRNQFPPGMW